MKPRSRKNKGKLLQNHVRDKIYETFPELEEGDVESRTMGEGGVDVMLSPKARRLVPVSFECKNWKAMPGKAEFRQAKANIYKDTLPAICWKPNRWNYEDSIVMISLNELLDWIKETQDGSKEE